MALKKLNSETLQLLCCPACHSGLKLASSKNSLKCKSKACGKRFAVKEGIPVMTA